MAHVKEDELRENPLGTTLSLSLLLGCTDYEDNYTKLIFARASSIRFYSYDDIVETSRKRLDVEDKEPLC